MVNHSCVIVERNHLFNLWAVENDLSTDALVPGFTNVSLYTEITSLISFFFLELATLADFNHERRKPAVA